MKIRNRFSGSSRGRAPARWTRTLILAGLAVSTGPAAAHELRSPLELRVDLGDGAGYQNDEEVGAANFGRLRIVGASETAGTWVGVFARAWVDDSDGTYFTGERANWDWLKKSAPVSLGIALSDPLYNDPDMPTVDIGGELLAEVWADVLATVPDRAPESLRPILRAADSGPTELHWSAPYGTWTNVRKGRWRRMLADWKHDTKLVDFITMAEMCILDQADGAIDHEWFTSHHYREAFARLNLTVQVFGMQGGDIEPGDYPTIDSGPGMPTLDGWDEIEPLPTLSNSFTFAFIGTSGGDRPVPEWYFFQPDPWRQLVTRGGDLEIRLAGRGFHTFAGVRFSNGTTQLLPVGSAGAGMGSITIPASAPPGDADITFFTNDFGSNSMPMNRWYRLTVLGSF